MQDLNIHSVLGVPVSCVSMSGALDIVDSAVASGSTLHIGVVNAAKIVNMRKDPELRQAVLASDIIFADGMSVVWAGRLLGVPIRERVTGIDLMFGMLERGNAGRYRVYLLGAKDEVVAEVAARIRSDYPNVVIAGMRNGYFGPDDEAAVAAQIADTRPDIVFVAITSPKKERFLARWASSIGARVYHGVGGSFDVYSGKVARAPKVWQRLGLEWLYRLLQEPGRLWKRYLYTNTTFASLVLRELFTGRRRTTRSRESSP